MRLLVLLLLSALATSAFAQINVPVAKVEKVKPAFLELLNNNVTIRKDSIMNERIVDLVNVYEADSIIYKKRQRHRSGVGWVAAMVGFSWRAITMKRQKFVGTSIHSYGAPGEAFLTEYDVKYNMVAHLPRYIEMAYWGYQRQHQRNTRITEEERCNDPSFCVPNYDNLESLYLHNELTPPKAYWGQLDSLFYPCVAGTRHVDHVNFGENPISLGMYGVYVSDCNHGCRPEMHPYEWIWWLEVNPKHDDRADEKRWLVGLMRESSNRFKRWSKKPRRGVVSVPFTFPVNQADKSIYIEHLVTAKLLPDGLADLPTLPADANMFDKTAWTVQLDGTNSNINVTSNQTQPDGVRWWMSNVQSDGEYITGYINIAASVDYVWTARVTVK